MQPNSSRIYWIDYLRGALTLLVVAHHSSLAYTTFASFNKDAYILSTHPVVDSVRWIGLDLFEDFNDIFFMSLLFLISGIFATGSLRQKGKALFIRDRFYRLFLPFAAGVTVLMLLAYYPAYLLAHGRQRLKDYVIDFFTVEAWPVGPPWFIWVLFAFNLLFTALYSFIQPLMQRVNALLAILKHHPFLLLMVWYGFTWLLYLPMMLWAGADTWTGIGPFDFQVSRVLLYFGYFLLGSCMGSTNLQKGLFAEGSAFVKQWRLWLAGSLLIYALLKLGTAPLKRALEQHELRLLQAILLYRSVWVLSCVMSCMALLTFFNNRFHRAKAWWIALSANAYGIYLIHYIFVTWCQYALLGYQLPAVIKFLLTFTVAVAASWLCTWLLRRIQPIRKYL